MNLPNKPIFVLSICFFTPLLLAFLLYQGYGATWFKQSAQGQLINPPRSITQTLNMQLPRGYWHLIWYVHQANATTWQRADSLHRLRLALGKHQNRLQLHLIFKHPLPLTNAQALQKETLFHIVMMPHLTMADDTLYIADPHHQLILYFAPGWNTKALYKDLKRLLTVNQES